MLGTHEIPRVIEEEAHGRRESAEAELETWVRRGIGEALRTIKSRFEDGADGLGNVYERNRMEYHNRRHTEDVIRRTETILRALKREGLVSARDLAIGKLAAAFHDAVQEWMEGERGGLCVRKRLIGQNETASAGEALTWMSEANEESEKEIFSDDDRRVVAEAIGVTVPGFNQERGTVVQPNLSETSSFIALAVALADLGSAGMDGPKKFLSEGDAIFREEHFEILDALKNPSAISDDKTEFYRRRMHDWAKSQVLFAEGRKTLFSDEIRGLPVKARPAVEKLFSQFDASIEGARRVAAKREGMTFLELSRDMGYVVNS